MTKGLLIFFLTIASCSSDNQEPIFHLFKASREYPNYREVDYLKTAGFAIGLVDDKKVLTKLKGKIEILFILSDDEDLESKIARYYLNSFDTLTADEAIKSFSGQRATSWRIENDSTLITSVAFGDSRIELACKERYEKVYLQSEFDLIHRVIKN